MVELDSLDLRILEELKNDGRMSITDLAKQVNSSRPTVTNRLERLRKEGIMKFSAGLDLRNLGLKMALVSIEVSGDKNRKKFLEVMSQCPRVQTIFRTPDVANVQVGVWGEDESALKSCIESFRDLPDVRIVDTKYLGTPIHGNVTIGVQLGDYKIAPCGNKCTMCSRYENEWCPGCPMTLYYRNPLLKDS